MLDVAMDCSKGVQAAGESWFELKSYISNIGNGMTFVRDYNDGESYAAVGLAICGGQDMTLSGVRNGEYVDAVTGNREVVSNGNLSFHIKGNSAGIYGLNGPGKNSADGVYLR